MRERKALIARSKKEKCSAYIYIYIFDFSGDIRTSELNFEKIEFCSLRVKLISECPQVFFRV